jgi:hypothetical protein
MAVIKSSSASGTAWNQNSNKAMDQAYKGVANGVAPLDSTVKVPIAYIPTGITGTTVAVGNDTRFSDQRVPTDGSVTLVKMSPNSVNGTIIADGSVGSAEIADGSITLPKLVDNTITLAKLANLNSNKLIGRAGTAGVPQEISIGAGLDLSVAGILTSTGGTGGGGGLDVTLIQNTFSTSFDYGAVQIGQYPDYGNTNLSVAQKSEILFVAFPYSKIQLLDMYVRLIGVNTATVVIKCCNVTSGTPVTLFTFTGAPGTNVEGLATKTTTTANLLLAGNSKYAWIVENGDPNVACEITVTNYNQY